MSTTATGSATEDRVLATQATRFANEEVLRIRSEEEIRAEVSAVVPQPTSTGGSAAGSGPGGNHVRLCRVSTYVYENDLVSKEGSNLRIVFPSFASHWAIFVTSPDDPDAYGLIYHLTFRDHRAAKLSADKSISREVCFTGSTMDAKPSGAKDVGTTRYTHPELMRLGKAMIAAFGDYHRVFWNCQHFARMYLDIITDGEAKFDEWTMGNTTNLFLCAFIMPIPAATTSKAVEHRRNTALLEHVRSHGPLEQNSPTGSTEPTEPDPTESEVLAASDAAIDLARILAEEDYLRNNPSPVKVMRTPRGGGGILATIREAVGVFLGRLAGRSQGDEV